MRRAIIVSALLALAACSGCRGFRLETPSSFIELDDQRRHEYDYRATTADGVVVAAQTLSNRRRGTLEFWAEAVRNKLRDARGYALLEETEVRARGGMPGKQMRFGRDEAGHTYRYWVTLFARHEGGRPRVWVIEAGGEQAAFERREEEVTRLISSFEPR